jgi:polysaccharide export outer membrane protein
MKNIIVLLVCAVFISSCASKKDIIYYQGIDEMNLENLTEIQPEFEIQVNDVLQVSIKTLNPDSAIPFNKMAGGGAMMGGAGGAFPGLVQLMGYLVDKNGDIELPFVGKVKVSGLSLQESEELIKSKLLSYLKDPYVSVRLLNYKYTVQGEVTVPGTYETFDPNLTLIQALGNAGDLRINGERHNILVIRTLNNERIVKRIDLTDPNWMNSPFYFIKQNDVIYVQPNKPRVTSSGYIGNVGTLLSVASILLSTVVLITSR